MAGTPYGPEQEAKIRQMLQYVYDRAYNLFIYSPLILWAANKEVNHVPLSVYGYGRFKEVSVTDKHWSVRGKSK